MPQKRLPNSLKIKQKSRDTVSSTSGSRKIFRYSLDLTAIVSRLLLNTDQLSQDSLTTIAMIDA